MNTLVWLKHLYAIAITPLALPWVRLAKRQAARIDQLERAHAQFCDVVIDVTESLGASARRQTRSR